jgi:hypothetical protein
MIRAFLAGVAFGLVPMAAGLVLGSACASIEMPEACDPGYVAAKQTAIALDCNGKRVRQCPGVTEDAYKADPALCPAVTACYQEIDKVGADCAAR